MRVSELLLQGATMLAPADDARRESTLLLRCVLGSSDAWLVAHADDVVEAPRVEAFLALVERRANGEPVAYLTGTRGFHAIELRVTPAVLIPRPETEVLVDLALERIAIDVEARVADLGTGSGAIALAIAHARPRAHVVATDVSVAALSLARENAEWLGLGNVEFRQCDWCRDLGSVPFDVIASNPPYVAAGDPHLFEGDLRFEPPLALSPGGDGLSAIRAIARDAREHLRDGGWLLLEHGIAQGEDVRAILASRGFREVFTSRDIEDRERVTAGRS